MQDTMPIRGRIFAGLLMLGLAATATAQDLIFTAPPRETPEAGRKLYTPLAQHLTQLLGRKVRYRHPQNWLNYQRDMRNDKYDIVFDGPHFASWRIAHLGHHVVVKLPGTLEFYLLTYAGNNLINSPDDLVGKKICGISPPNLSTLSVLAYYQNPVRQPVIKGIRGGMGKVYKTFIGNGGCDAMVLRTTFFKKKLNDEQRRQLKIIYHPPPLPNQVITASKRVSPGERAKMVESLVNGPGKVAAAGIVRRFGGKKAKSFVPAEQKEYLGHNELLEGVIFGW